MNKKIILFLILLLLFSILLIDYSHLQEEVKKKPIFAFFNGNKYLDIPDDYKILYVAGLLDMWSYLGRRYWSEAYSTFLRKIEHMSMGQVQAIFDKYLEEHPEEWHFPAADIFNSAMCEMVEKQ